ncbi:MAG: RNA polymerase sigma factor [Pseudomonadota bacterium]
MADDLQKARDTASSDELEPETLARDNAGWMLILAERLLRDRALAEDVVQDALIRAINGSTNFEHRSSVKTWLRRITINTALSKLRQQQRLAEQPIDEHLPEFDRYDCRVEAPWSHLASVDEVTQSDQLRQHVYMAIGELPDAYRVVLLLRDIEGYDTAEVAKLLELSTTNVKVRLHRARAALKKLLEPVLRGEVT